MCENFPSWIIFSCLFLVVTYRKLNDGLNCLRRSMKGDFGSFIGFYRALMYILQPERETR